VVRRGRSFKGVLQKVLSTMRAQLGNRRQLLAEGRVLRENQHTRRVASLTAHMARYKNSYSPLIQCQFLRRSLPALPCWARQRPLKARDPAISSPLSILSVDASSFALGHRIGIFSGITRRQLLCTCSQDRDLLRHREPAPLHLVTG
jgi:hypothetical protein